MPCESITMQSIALAKAQPAILVEALKALGWNITQSTAAEILATMGGASLSWRAGEGLAITAASNYEAKRLEGAIVQAYSRAAVSWAAGRAGWQVAKSDGNKITLTRR